MFDIVVTMDGVDITSTAVSGGAISIPTVTGAVTITAAASVPSVTYTITRNLTNCASSNTADSIAEGAAYTTSLTPTGTFKKLGTITVTMGGVDISSSAVSGSAVTIASVTGDITITCAAVITNLIDTIGISADTRLSTGSGINKPHAGWATIGANMDAASLIHLVDGDTLRIKGVSLPATSDGSYTAVAEYSAAGAFSFATYLWDGCSVHGTTYHNTTDGIIATQQADQYGGYASMYIRLSLICADASAVIMTINEEIP